MEDPLGVSGYRLERGYSHTHDKSNYITVFSSSLDYNFNKVSGFG